MWPETTARENETPPGRVMRRAHGLQATELSKALGSHGAHVRPGGKSRGERKGLL